MVNLIIMFRDRAPPRLIAHLPIHGRGFPYEPSTWFAIDTSVYMELTDHMNGNHRTRTHAICIQYPSL